MTQQFPRTTVGGISLPRMIIGTNWLLGWSHTGAAADAGIKEKFQTAEDFYPVLHTYLAHGVDAIMAPVSDSDLLLSGIHLAEDRDGKKIHIIDTPILNVDDSAAARSETEEIKALAGDGKAEFISCDISDKNDREKGVKLGECYGNLQYGPGLSGQRTYQLN